MSRHTEIVYPGSTTATKAVQVPFVADACRVVNTSGYTLLMRVGSRSVPASNFDTDLERVPPGMVYTFPVTGELYGLALASPATLAVPAGNDAICIITWSKGEPLGSFGAVPLLGSDAPESALINHASDGVAAYTASFPVSGTLKEITFLQGASNNITSVVLIGHTTGYIYASIPAAYLGATNPRPRIPIYASLDAQIDVYVYSGGTNPFVVIGHYGSLDRGLYAGSGAQIVIARPMDGNSSIPVGLIDGSGAVQGNSINPLYVSPTYAHPDRAVRTLLAPTVFAGAGTANHGPYDMLGATGGLFVVHVTVGAVNVSANVSPDGVNSFESPGVGPFVGPAYITLDFAPGASSAGGATGRFAVALKGQETVQVTRSGGCTYAIYFYPSTFA